MVHVADEAFGFCLLPTPGADEDHGREFMIQPTDLVEVKDSQVVGTETYDYVEIRHARNHPTEIQSYGWVWGKAIDALPKVG